MGELNCQKCKNWQNCLLNFKIYYLETEKPEIIKRYKKGWYHFGEIRWCPFQIIWILQNADILDAGQWPPQYDAEAAYSKQMKAEGRHVKPKVVIMEVKIRMETIGIKGKLLLSEIKAGETLFTMDPEAREVVMYLKGNHRKDQDFNTWKAKRKYQQKLAECQQKKDKRIPKTRVLTSF